MAEVVRRPPSRLTKALIGTALLGWYAAIIAGAAGAVVAVKGLALPSLAEIAVLLVVTQAIGVFGIWVCLRVLKVLQHKGWTRRVSVATVESQPQAEEVER